MVAGAEAGAGLVSGPLVPCLTAAGGSPSFPGDTCFHRKAKRPGTCQQLSDCKTITAPDQRQQCAFRRGDSVPTVCCLAAPAAAPTAPATAFAGTPDRPGGGPSGPDGASSPCHRVLQEAEQGEAAVVSRPSPRRAGTIARESEFGQPPL